ncbi:MAG: TraB/GumN family protein [Kiritimatiellae bacterium]|jgi:uncharacterized protein YbaP (TraB family)|nr:TraB/GumN family protein [Kiritimatiellia bacterium]
MTVIRFAFFCLIFAGGTGRGESSVWKVQKEESVMYLGGTCHMLRKSDFPLPEEFDQAYNASARLVLEVNMEEVNGAAFQRKLLARARYPDGETIKDHLSGEAYGALEAYCRTHHFPLGAFEQFKPSMLMITLSVMELVKHGVTLEGVDHYYDRKAQQNGMPRDALETADEQLEFILTMADGIEDETVLHTLRDLKTLKQDFDELIKAWRTGDEKMLDKLFLEEM